MHKKEFILRPKKYLIATASLAIATWVFDQTKKYLIKTKKYLIGSEKVFDCYSQPRHRHLGSDLSDESGGEDSDRGTEVFSLKILFDDAKGRTVTVELK